MLNRRRFLLSFAICVFLAPHAVAQPPAAAPPPAQTGTPLSVMSFNIRYGTAKDGDNHWTLRRQMLFDLMKEQNADVVGLQEALDPQIREIVAAMPVYGVVGVGRDDARTAGEYSAILFRKDRLHVAEAGTFWFSDTPGNPGSRSWGNNITRICTWARFIDRDGRAFWHFNVHLDHQSQPSRERSAELLLARVTTRAFPSEPVVVTGDFNVGEDNLAIRHLLGPSDATLEAVRPFVDTFRVVHPDEKQVGTFSGFTFGRIDGPKIDYVLVQPGTEVLDAAIVRTSRENRYPSDHFPVTARIRFMSK
jgi:endonuclease/exonuclease/phosphatase family metal-dependent hydrolase